MSVRAREFRYAATLDRLGNAKAERGGPLELGEEWTPEHLLLASLMRCTVASLRFHGERAGIGVLASATAAGLVTKREEDGRYAFVEIDVEVDAELDPEPADLGKLLAEAERGCFIGATLTAKPTYRWTVNGATAGIG